MAYLHALAVEAGNGEVMPAGKVFRTTTHHVKEIILYFLPPKFMLDGSSKLQITLHSNPAQPAYKVMLGTTEYVVGGFDFRRYFLSTAEEQQRTVCAAIRSALRAICDKAGGSDALVDEACQEAERTRFSLRYEIERLRKSVRGTKTTIRIFRCLAHGVGESWEAELERDSQVLQTTSLRSEGFVDLRDFYKSASVEGNSYFIRDRFEDTVFSLDTSCIAP